MREFCRSRTASIRAGILIALLVLPWVFRTPTWAVTVNEIFSDLDLTSSQSMSVTRIQQFLESRGSFLAQHSTAVNGSQRTAAEMIADVSREFRLSPKFFLTLLQKEQSLVTDPDPTSEQIDFALGYGCPSSCSSEYRGFQKQLRSAAARIRNDYLPALEQQGQFNGWGPGRTKTSSDGIPVTPSNMATAVLYIYNPVVGSRGGGDPRYGGNSLFQHLWNSWFSLRHPDGSLLRVAGRPDIWLIRNGQRSPFASEAVFLSNYDRSKVVTVERTEIETYAPGPIIRYPEPSVLQTKAGGIYILAGGIRRPIASKAVFKQLGYNPEELIRGVDEADLTAYPKGQQVASAEVFPLGRLVQAKRSGGIAFIDSNNVRHAIYAKEIFRSQFRGQRPEKIDDAALARLANGKPMTFRDGELIGSRKDRKVYFVSHGERRLLPDLETFNTLGFKTKNIIWTTTKAVSVHPLGDVLVDIH